MTQQLHAKGIVFYTCGSYEEGGTPLIEALEGSGAQVDYLPNHRGEEFPREAGALAAYDAVVLSDIASDTLLLDRSCFVEGRSRSTASRWCAPTSKGGALLMVEGSMSFSGWEGKAHYGRTAVAFDPTEIAECLDVLRVHRVDHGYAVLRDRTLLDRCVRAQTPFSTCWLVDFPSALAADRQREVGEMIGAGLNVSISSDDPAMIGSHIGRDFEDAAARLRWTQEDAERFSLSGLDACFGDEDTAGGLRDAFTAILAQIRPLARFA